MYKLMLCPRFCMQKHSIILIKSKMSLFLITVLMESIDLELIRSKTLAVK